MNLKTIARDATRRGDTRTLFQSLDLLERLMPMVNGRVDGFMDFCTELEDLRLRGKRSGRAEALSILRSVVKRGREDGSRKIARYVTSGHSLRRAERASKQAHPKVAHRPLTTTLKAWRLRWCGHFRCGLPSQSCDR
jgi:hypothetical protein